MPLVEIVCMLSARYSANNIEYASGAYADANGAVRLATVACTCVQAILWPLCDSLDAFSHG